MNPAIRDESEDADSEWSADSELGRVLDAYLAAIEAGEPVDPEAIAAANPRIADRFLACIPVLHMSARIAGGEIALDPAAGVRLGDFVLLRTIGQGGMGIVFEARQLSLGRQVALKALPLASALDSRQLTRFQTEARAAAQLHHTNIVPIFSVGCERGVHFYAMQLIEGRTLSAVVRELREAPATGWAAARHRLVAELGLQAAEALEHAHRQGIVHRDVKPSNLMVDVRNNLWITDFGLARMDGEGGLTAQGDVLGTLRYMSPEQSSGDHSSVDHRTDVYSLGATLYELATLHPVLPGRDRDELLRDQAVGEPRGLRSWDRSIPRDLETIILRALNRDRDHRYATAGAMAEDFRRFLDHRPIHARRPSLLTRAERWTRRHKALSASLVFALLLAAVGGAVIASLAFRNRDLDLSHRRLDQIQRHSGYVHDVARAGDFVHLNMLDEAVAVLSRHIPAPGAEDERSFAWHYLWRLCHVRPQQLKGHLRAVYHVEYSSDGRSLVTAGEDGTIRIWDVAATAPPRVFRGHVGDVDCASFSPDGKTLASCGDDGTVRLWNPLDENEPSVVLGRHEREAVSIAFGLDGRTLFSGDDRGEIKSWDVIDRRPLRSAPPLNSRIEAMAVAADGRTLSVAASTAGMWMLDAQSLEWKERLPGFLAVFSAAVSRDGKIVAAAERDGRVRLRVETAGGPIERVLALEPPGRVSGLALSHHERVLAACDAYGITRLWDVESGVMLRSFRSNHRRTWAVAFSPDGRKLATCGMDGAVEIWDARDEQDVRNALLPLPIDADVTPTLTPGQFTASYADDPNGLLVQTWEFAEKAMRPGARRRIDWSRKGVFAPDGGGLAVYLSGRPWLQVVEAYGNAALPPFEGIPDFSSPVEAYNRIQPPTFSPDGGRIATSINGVGVFVWDVASGRLLATDRDDSSALSFSPRGDLLATVNSNVLRVRDLATAKVRDYADPGYGFPGTMTFTPDGRKLLVGFRNSRFVKVWNLDQFEAEPGVLKVLDDPSALAVSADGRIVACGSEAGDVTLFDLVSLQSILTLDAPPGRFRQLRFSPDGSTLLAVRYFDPKTPPIVEAWTFAPSADPWLGPAEFNGR